MNDLTWFSLLLRILGIYFGIEALVRAASIAANGVYYASSIWDNGGDYRLIAVLSLCQLLLPAAVYLIASAVLLLRTRVIANWCVQRSVQDS